MESDNRRVETSQASASLVYVGLDEAGYGPMLGPLCVGLAAIRVRGWRSEAGQPSRAPDVWELLSPAVSREPRAARAGGVVINDSKRLKGASSAKPLLHLERGVACVLHALGATPGSDAELLDALGGVFPPEVWYEGGPIPFPSDADGGEIALSANAMRAACERAGVEMLSLRVRLVGEREFNDGCELRGGKGSVNLAAAGEFVREVWQRWGGEGAELEGGVRLVMDRHGGRVKYGPFLAGVTGGDVVALEECAGHSRYAVTSRAGEPERRMTVLLSPEADGRHFPVALASMAAKLAREAAMARLNRHFGARLQGLKPTAGYVQDARRWLQDAGGVISASERRVMVRRW